MWLVDVLLLLQEILGLVNQPRDHVLQSPVTVHDIKQLWILIFHGTLQINKRLRVSLHTEFEFSFFGSLCVCVSVGRNVPVHMTGPHHARVPLNKKHISAHDTPPNDGTSVPWRRSLHGDQAPLTSSLVSCSGSSSEQQPVCHMTSVQPSACLYFRVHRAE